MLICKYLAFIWVYIDESGEDMTQEKQRQGQENGRGGVKLPTNDTENT